MNEGRHAHALIRLNDLVYVFAGYQSNTAEKYDLINNTWTMIESKLPEEILVVNCAYH